MLSQANEVELNTCTYIQSPVCNYISTNHQYIKILLVCLSVRDGCGRGHNEFAGRVQNYHLRTSCHRNGIFLEIVKAAAGRTLCVASYANDASNAHAHVDY